ncbi:MAG: hypothetical protein ACQEUY_04915 [Pseudomonadota bacterium]
MGKIVKFWGGNAPPFFCMESMYMLKISRQGLKASVLITLIISILDYFRGKEFEFVSVVIMFFIVLVVYETVGFIGGALNKIDK